MRTAMLSLTWRYLKAQDLATSVRLEIVQLLREIEAEYIFDEIGRQLKMREMQRSLYAVILAKQLSGGKKFKGVPPRKLLGEAENILDKDRNPDMRDKPPPQMRTPDEQRMYGALRVRWFELVKLAGIRPLPSGPQR